MLSGSTRSLGFGASAASPPQSNAMWARFTVLARHPHHLCDRRLRHPGFPQQNHLNALTKQRCLRPSQHPFQPPNLSSVAFDHLLASESDGLSESDRSGAENRLRPALFPQPSTFRFNPLWKWYQRQ